MKKPLITKALSVWYEHILSKWGEGAVYRGRNINGKALENMFKLKDKKELITILIHQMPSTEKKTMLDVNEAATTWVWPYTVTSGHII